LNKSGYGPLLIAILAQSFDVFYSSPVNRAQARQHWGVFFWGGGKGHKCMFFIFYFMLKRTKLSDHVLVFDRSVQNADCGLQTGHKIQFADYVQNTD